MWVRRAGLVLPIWLLIGCMGTPDESEGDGQALGAGNTLTVPAVMGDTFVTAFGAGGANVAITPVRSTTTATLAAMPSAQQFGAVLTSAPAGFTDYIPFYTAGYAAVRGSAPASPLSGISTTQLQGLICPVSPQTCTTSVGATSLTLIAVADVSDTADSVVSGLCGSRPICSGVVLVADGATAPVGRQVTTWPSTAPFALTGIGKPCLASGEPQGYQCLHRIGASSSGALAYGDSRVQLGSGTRILDMDGITPSSSTIPGTYPRVMPIHLVETSTTVALEIAWRLWLHGDGTLAHPSHHSAFLGFGQGLIPSASF